MPKLKTIVLAYIPVVHSGYLKFLKEAVEKEEASELILIDGELAREWAPTHKDLHALTSSEIKKIIGVLVPELTVKIVKNLDDFKKREGEFILICPEELVTRGVVESLEKLGMIEVGEVRKAKIIWQPVFLRWDKKKALEEKEVDQDETISEAEFDQKMMALATEEGKLSSDWWRRVGAVLVRDQKIIMMAHNQHLPHEQQPNVEGDIRGQFHKGEHWDLGTAIHSEAVIIARAAGEGIFVAGAELYVTDFPCPNCAKLIAESGIRTVYYGHGYAVSDGERVLKAAGVKLIRVK